MAHQISSLKQAINRLHGCQSRYVESVHVHETWQGETVWDGTVEVFDLLDHPTAKRAYAWAHETDEGGTRYVAVLHEGPIDSPRAAVQAAVVAEIKERARKEWSDRD